MHKCHGRKIDRKLTVIEEPDKSGLHPLGFWHAHFVKVDRKNAIILINDLTSYTVVLFRPKKKDFQNLEEQIELAIRNTMKTDGYLETVIDEYFNASPSVLFTKWLIGFPFQTFVLLRFLELFHLHIPWQEVE